MHSGDRRLTFVGLRPTGDLAGLTAYSNRKGKVVWFPKSPPTKPASIRQLHQRYLFAAAAQGWRTLCISTQVKWKAAAAAAHLFLTGYTLWMSWRLKPDRGAMRTIERITNIQLIH